MGYNLTIGNAVLGEACPDTHVYSVDVDGASHPDAPAFGEPTDGTSQRWPSYSGWSEFCKEVGLTELFYDRECGLLSRHPGTFALTQGHLDTIAAALKHRRATNGGKEPGFPDETPEGELIDNGKDGQLARLVWLEYWVRWALENCERPAMRNT
jgi:hypothetical protein